MLLNNKYEHFIYTVFLLQEACYEIPPYSAPHGECRGEEETSFIQTGLLAEGFIFQEGTGQGLPRTPSECDSKHWSPIYV